MTVIVENGFAVRIPELASRYRANCSKEWGCFVTGETKGLNHSKAEKAGLTKGSFVEMALVWVDQKLLTFEPNYINEQFTEIWGIPVAGEMKTQFPDNASELSTFLIHRQSKDKLKGIIEVFSREIFSNWVNEGMNGDYEEYSITKSSDNYFQNIFRFELTQTEGNFGVYHYVQTTIRKAENELENKALIIAKKIYEGQLNGLGYCTDSRLELNQEKCLANIQSAEVEKSINVIADNVNGKLLKSAK